MKMKGAYQLWSALPRVRPYMRPYRRLVASSYVLTVLATVVALAVPWPLAVLIDSALGSGTPPGIVRAVIGTDKVALLVSMVGLSFLLTVTQNALAVFTDYVNAKLEQRMVLDLRADLFAHAQRLSLTFHDASRTGEMMSRINYQASSIGAITVAFPPLIESVLTVVGMLVIALLIDWQVALVSLCVVPVLWYSFGLYGTRIVPRLQRVQALEWQSLSIVHESMAMLRVIVAFGREKHEHTRFRDQGLVAVDERVKLTVRQTGFSLAVSTATAAGTALVFLFGAYHVMQGQLSGGSLLILLSYISAVYKPLEAISGTVGSLHEQLVALNASFELLDKEPEVVEHDDPVELDRARGAVTFEDVSFNYTGRVATLSDISFEAAPGQRVAVVGPTGAGKTTLISVLIRYYDPKQGRVLIDGIDTKRLSLASLRSQISVVLQEPLLFSASIADNIRYGRLDASMDEIVEAARAANAHDFISALPKGYDTELGERGATLSGGERQRISVARAFLKDAPILVLDEPTSSIDSRTERVILDALEDLMIGRTSFVIAHRLSTISEVDKILVISDGRLVEQGTHDELLTHAGTYRQLYEAQNRPRPRRFERGSSVPLDAGRETREEHEPELEPNGEGQRAAEHSNGVNVDEAAQNLAEPFQAPSGGAGSRESISSPTGFIDFLARVASDSSDPERARRATVTLGLLADEERRELEAVEALVADVPADAGHGDHGLLHDELSGEPAERRTT